MEIDYGVIIGLIATASAAGVLGLSYVGVYLLGRAHGRREADRELRTAERGGPGDRLHAVEGAVDSVSRAVARLAEAQRLLLLDQSRREERSGSGAAEQRRGFPLASGSNTPA